MARAGNQIYATDYTDLKKQLDAELNRRGKSEGTAQGQSVGSMSAYILAAPQVLESKERVCEVYGAIRR